MQRKIQFFIEMCGGVSYDRCEKVGFFIIIYFNFTNSYSASFFTLSDYWWILDFGVKFLKSKLLGVKMCFKGIEVLGLLDESGLNSLIRDDDVRLDYTDVFEGQQNCFVYF